MAPIYDTDLAEERFTKTEWHHYELWERVEQRLRRRKLLWIAGTAVVFLALSAVPIITDRFPKWYALSLTRRIAVELNQLKRDSALNHEAYRIRFHGENSLDFTIEAAPSCSAAASGSGRVIRSGQLASQVRRADYRLLGPVQGKEMSIPGLVESFCYDYLAGNDAVLRGESMVGVGVIPVKDLPEGRMDRLALLVLSGPGAESSFE